MIERRKTNDRRKARTLNILDTWAGIGVFARLIFTIAIIACFLWSLKTIAETVLWLYVLLA